MTIVGPSSECPPVGSPVGPTGPAHISGHRATAHVVATAARSGRGVRFPVLRCEPPLTFRNTADALVLVGTAAGPLGGDDLHLRVDVGAGATLSVASAGAALVQPGPHGEASTFTIVADVASGASLTFHVEPTVLTAAARHRTDTTITVGPDSDLVWVDELVLGRHDESAGHLTSRLSVEDPAGRPMLRTGFDTGRPGWAGPAGAGGHRGIGQVVLAGRPARRWEEHGADGGTGPGEPRIEFGTAVLADGTIVVTTVGAVLDVRAAIARVVRTAAGG